MYNNVEEEILKLTKDIFNKQDTRLMNFALQDIYTTITGKQKYVKTELDLIIVLYQLWTNNGKNNITTNSSINITTAELNAYLGVAKTVSSTLANIKKYSVHEKKVFSLDADGNRYKIGKSYAKDIIIVTPDVVLFEFTVRDEFVRNGANEIIGRNTIYTIKPTLHLIEKLCELGLNDLEQKQTSTNETMEENVQDTPSTVEMEDVSDDIEPAEVTFKKPIARKRNTSYGFSAEPVEDIDLNDLDCDFDEEPEIKQAVSTFANSDNIGKHGFTHLQRTNTEDESKEQTVKHKSFSRKPRYQKPVESKRVSGQLIK